MADTIRVVIEGVDAASNVLAGIRKETDQLNRSMRQVGLALAATGAAITGVLGLSVKAAAEQEQATATLAIAMKTVGTFTQEALQQQLEFANALQRTTVFADEEITRMQALLVNLAHLSGPALEQATRATLGFAAVLGIDMDTAARQVSQVLNGAATSVGRFSLDLKEGASTLDRFNAVLQTGTGFMRTAEAQAATFGGRLQQFRNQLDELGESIGVTLLPALTNLLKTATQLIDRFNAFAAAHPKLTGVLVQLTAAIGVLALVVAPILTSFSALARLFQVIWPVIAAVAVELGPLLAALAVLLLLIHQLDPGFNVLIGTVDAFIATLQLLGQIIIGVVVTAVDLLARKVEQTLQLLALLPGKFGDPFRTALEHVRTFREEMDLLVRASGTAISEAAGGIPQAFEGQGPLAGAIQQFGAVVSQPAGGAALPDSGGTSGPVQGFQTQLQELQKTFDELTVKSQESFTTMQQGLLGFGEGIVRFLEQMKTKWGEHWTTLRGFVTNFTTTAANAIATNLGKAIGDIILGTQSASEAFKELGRAIVEAIVRFIAEYAAQLLVAKALSLVFKSFVTSTAIQIADAWLPAAVLATIATLGAAAVQAPFTVTGALGATKGALAAFIQGFGAGGGNVPQLAEGGLVTRPTLALLGEAGPEAVVPLDRTAGAGGSTTISITIDKAELTSPENIDQFAEALTARIGRLMEIRNMMPAGAQL